MSVDHVLCETCQSYKVLDMFPLICLIMKYIYFPSPSHWGLLIPLRCTPALFCSSSLLRSVDEHISVRVSLQVRQVMWCHADVTRHSLITITASSDNDQQIHKAANSNNDASRVTFLLSSWLQVEAAASIRQPDSDLLIRIDCSTRGSETNPASSTPENSVWKSAKWNVNERVSIHSRRVNHPASPWSVIWVCTCHTDHIMSYHAHVDRQARDHCSGLRFNICRWETTWCFWCRQYEPGRYIETSSRVCGDRTWCVNPEHDVFIEPDR